MMAHVEQPWTWRSPPELSGFVARLERILAGWRGTRYLAGSGARGTGADCVGFVAGVLDEMFGTTTPRSHLPADLSLHSRVGAIAAMRAIRRTFRAHYAVKDGVLEPGDVVVTGPVDGGPGHAMIVGCRRAQVWHCTPGGGVCRTGYSITGLHKVFRVYRMEDRR